MWVSWTEEQSVPRQGWGGPSENGCLERLCDQAMTSTSALWFAAVEYLDTLIIRRFSALR